MTRIRILLAFLLAVLSAGSLSAQKKGEFSIKVQLTDSVSREPVSFATIYVSKDGSTENAYYSMTDGDGKGVVTGIPAGKYVFVADLMGYPAYGICLGVGAVALGVGLWQLLRRPKAPDYDRPYVEPFNAGKP